MPPWSTRRAAPETSCAALKLDLSSSIGLIIHYRAFSPLQWPWLGGPLGVPFSRPRWRANFGHPAVQGAGTVWPTYWSLRPRFPWRSWPLDSQQLVSGVRKNHGWLHVGNLQKVGLIWFHTAWPGFGEVLLSQLLGGPYLLFTVRRCCGEECLRVCAYVQLKVVFKGRSSIAFFTDWINLGQSLGTAPISGPHGGFFWPTSCQRRGIECRFGGAWTADLVFQCVPTCDAWAAAGCELRAKRCPRDQHELQMFGSCFEPTLWYLTSKLKTLAWKMNLQFLDSTGVCRL